MKFVYASRTGNVKKIVEMLGIEDAVKIETGNEKIEGEYIIFTYTIGIGMVPGKTARFLENNPGVRGVVGSGSNSWTHRRTFNYAAEKIGSKYGIPVLAKLDGIGTPEDIRNLKERIEEFK